MSLHKAASKQHLDLRANEKLSESRFAQGDALHLPERKCMGGHQAWRRVWFAEMGMIVYLSSERPQT